MKKLSTAFLVLISFSLSAQTLFNYGDDSVTVKEFLKAYRKNNTGQKSEKAFRDYLDLYVASRLKIKEATEKGYDTLPQIVADLQNLRQQILPNYLNDKESVNRLVNEAYLRSKKNIHLAHIFIAAGGGMMDTSRAYDKLQNALAKLKGGANFADVAKQFSEDPAAKTNGGELGWITVFTLPYPLENLAYSTLPGKISTVYRSKAGYHIFKNLDETPDRGKIKAAQILLAFPPDDPSKETIQKRADSIYNRLLRGDDFGKLATQFSNDVVSAAANGQMQEFGIGEYEPLFEKTVFALPKDGAISAPFLTTHGFHIVKRLGKKTSSWNRSDKKSMEQLRTAVERSDRMLATKSALAARILKMAGYKKADFNAAELYALSDSAITYQKPSIPVYLNSASPLFSLQERTYNVSDWIAYAQAFRYKSDGSGFKSFPQVWDEFVETSALDFYQSHLENFNEDFKQQITEFREGNLFFEIMQRQVWGPAQSDSAALVDYYNNHRTQYNWKKSADAVIFYASDLASAITFREALRKSPAGWKELVNHFSEKIAADSSRFELVQLPGNGKIAWKPGVISPAIVNKNDNTASFTYLLKMYEAGGTRSFAEARGLVINDYQNALEKQWIEELKKKYPVKMNTKAVEELVAKKSY